MSCVILMYHVIDEPRSASEARFCCSPQLFAAQMAYLHSGGWNVVPLADVLEAVQGQRQLPARAVAITFDDGTRCTAATALPILRQHGFPATVFVVSGLMDKGNEWMVREGHPARDMLTADEVRQLAAAGIEIGSHTANHAKLGAVDEDIVTDELRSSKVTLENLLGKTVRYFAYPYGSHTPRVKELTRVAGYSGACTTLWGKNRTGTDPFGLQRIEIKGDEPLWKFKLKVRTGTHDMPPWSALRSQIKRLAGIRS